MVKWQQEMKYIISSAKIAALVTAFSLFACFTFFPAPVFAATCPPGQTEVNGQCKCPSGQQAVTLPVDQGGSGCVPINQSSASLEDNPIFFYLRNILIFLSGGVGLAVVGGIIFGAYMYITARGNAAQTQQGQTVIINAVVGLLLYIFMFAILQFIIPGGILR